uniref:DUF202 domain-containing protein n=1 Tax=Macrostomum lignano TaxID=282301 RepID=A0A1I8FHR6_9PLAT
MMIGSQLYRPVLSPGQAESFMRWVFAVSALLLRIAGLEENRRPDPGHLRRLLGVRGLHWTVLAGHWHHAGPLRAGCYPSHSHELFSRTAQSDCWSY